MRRVRLIQLSTCEPCYPGTGFFVPRGVDGRLPSASLPLAPFSFLIGLGWALLEVDLEGLGPFLQASPGTVEGVGGTEVGGVFQEQSLGKGQVQAFLRNI